MPFKRRCRGSHAADDFADDSIERFCRAGLQCTDEPRTFPRRDQPGDGGSAFSFGPLGLAVGGRRRVPPLLACSKPWCS